MFNHMTSNKTTLLITKEVEKFSCSFIKHVSFKKTWGDRKESSLVKAYLKGTKRLWENVWRL